MVLKWTTSLSWLRRQTLLVPPIDILLSEVMEDSRLDWRRLEGSEVVCRSLWELVCACTCWLFREAS